MPRMLGRDVPVREGRVHSLPWSRGESGVARLCSATHPRFHSWCSAALREGTNSSLQTGTSVPWPWNIKSHPSKHFGPLQCLGKRRHWLGLTVGVEREVGDLRHIWEVGSRGLANGLECRRWRNGGWISTFQHEQTDHEWCHLPWWESLVGRRQGVGVFRLVLTPKSTQSLSHVPFQLFPLGLLTQFYGQSKQSWAQ